MLEVVDEEAGTHEEHQDGDQLGNTAGDHGLGGVGRVTAAEDALGVELVGPEGGHVLERHGKETDPKGELNSRIGAEVENAEFTGLAGLGDQGAPAAIERADNPKQGEDATKNENTKLNHIGPDDGGHPAHQGPEHGEPADDPDAKMEIDARAGSENKGGDQEADALTEDGAKEEQQGGEALGAVAQTVANVVIRAEDLALVEHADKPDGHDEAGDDRAEGPLEIGEVPLGSEDHARDTDKGEGADLGGDNGAGDGGPGKAPTAEEEVANGGLFSAQSVADPGSQKEVTGDNAPIETGEVGGDGHRQPREASRRLSGDCNRRGAPKHRRAHPWAGRI